VRAKHVLEKTESKCVCRLADLGVMVGHATKGGSPYDTKDVAIYYTVGTLVINFDLFKQITAEI
jgi:uncharacterized ferredoxin-like protein